MARSGQSRTISFSKGLVLMVVFVDCNREIDVVVMEKK
jgi:hypothetical protein